MTESSWILRADATSSEEVVGWLAAEAQNGYVLKNDTDVLEIDFRSIDDAFRFRMQFDCLLV